MAAAAPVNCAAGPCGVVTPHAATVDSATVAVDASCCRCAAIDAGRCRRRVVAVVADATAADIHPRTAGAAPVRGAAACSPTLTRRHTARVDGRVNRWERSSRATTCSRCCIVVLVPRKRRCWSLNNVHTPPSPTSRLRLGLSTNRSSPAALLERLQLVLHVLQSSKPFASGVRAVLPY